MCRVMASAPIGPMPMVYPSGADFATTSMPIVSAPPGRFSTTTGWPRAFDISGARMRATVSVALPGAWGTINLRGRSGNCAAAPADNPSARQTARNLPERAKNLPDDVAARLHRVLADILFLFGDHEEQAVLRLLRHVVVQVRLLLLHQAELHALLRVLVVFLRQLHLGRGPLHDRQELFPQLLRRAALEVLRP